MLQTPNIPVMSWYLICYLPFPTRTPRYHELRVSLQRIPNLLYTYSPSYCKLRATRLLPQVIDKDLAIASKKSTAKAGKTLGVSLGVTKGAKKLRKAISVAIWFK